MGAVGTTNTGTEGTAKMGIVGIAETSAMGVVGAVVKGISTSTTTPGPSKVFAKHENRHANKGRLQ